MNDEPNRIAVDLNHLRYLHFALDAAVNGSWDDDEHAAAIGVAQTTALKITELIFGIDEGIGAVCAYVPSPFPAIPDLPPPGSVQSNPLLPDPTEHDHSAQEPPTAVVYGIFDRFEGFVFLDDSDAEALVGEVVALNCVRTLGELRALFPTLEHVHGPIDPAEDDWPYETDDTPIDLSECESWPPFPAYYTGSVLPTEVIDDLGEQAGAEWHAPVFDGEFMIVPTDREQDMQAVLARHGIAARRDDVLIAGLGE
jgi:hypothetical protein